MRTVVVCAALAAALLGASVAVKVAAPARQQQRQPPAPATDVWAVWCRCKPGGGYEYQLGRARVETYQALGPGGWRVISGEEFAGTQAEAAAWEAAREPHLRYKHDFFPCPGP